MGLMAVGFFKPEIPAAGLGQFFGPAPDMEVKNINGKVINLQQLKGKVVFVNFWATWCPPCLGELPSVNTLYQKFRNDTNVVFLAVDVDNDLSKSTKFLQAKGYTMPVYAGDDLHVPHTLYNEGIPTTLVINKKGFIAFKHLNRANYADPAFEDFIVQLTKQ